MEDVVIAIRDQVGLDLPTAEGFRVGWSGACRRVDVAELSR